MGFKRISKRQGFVRGENMSNANLRTYQLGVTTIALGATPILINLDQEYVTGARINVNASMVIVPGATGVSLAQGVPVATVPLEINGPARFYVAGSGNLQMIIYKTANDSIYGS